MKIPFFLLCLSGSLSFFSCIQDEAPNAEADILTCTLADGSILKSEPEISNESVVLIVRSDADITQLAPQFTLTPGASIAPESGSARDFTTPQYYTVTSEDKNWNKTYEVRCIVSGLSTEYHFENIDFEPRYGRYHIFYDLAGNGDRMQWSSANSGFALTGAQKPEEFPTSQADDGYKGKCAKLVTRSTGSLGAMVNMYMASGNLFIGTFDAVNAMIDALKATRFGRPFEHVPTYLSGYYKYKAGKEFKVKGEIVEGRKDQCDIYAVFFETTDDVKYLDGTNVLTSPNLVSVARITNQKETDEWTHFYIPFIARPGKAIDKEKLKNGGYQLAVLFASSIRGDYFEGAEGSTLYIDEVEVIYSDDE